MADVVEGDIGFAQWFDELSDELAELDFGEPLRQTADELRDIHQSYFESGAGPDGQTWADWMFRSVDASYDHPTMIASGRLMESMAGGPDHIEEITKTTLEFGTSVPYAYKHQEGGSFIVDDYLISRDGQHEKQPGDTINLPQREFVGVIDDDVDRIADKIADHVARMFAGDSV